MSDIFFSYSSLDRERARIIAELLKKQGWSVWWDREIPIGERFEDVIERELDAAKCEIVLWSKDSVISKWVKTEASEGEARNILVPILLDDVKIPLAFRQIQTANLVDWDWKSPHQEFQRLLESVMKIVPPQRPLNMKEMAIAMSEVKPVKKISNENYSRENLLRLLRENIISFNKLRSENPDLKIKFSNENFYRADLSNADLSNIYLNGANLSKADLSKANLSGTNLSEADLTKANLSEANLANTNLVGANLTEANLGKANLSDSNLSNAYLSRSILAGANLSKADLSNSNLTEAVLTNANISGAKLNGANLFNAKLNGAKLVNVEFPDANLSGVDFSKADLSNSNLSGTKLDEADLSNANFYNTNLSGANMYRADLTNTNLSKANLTKANLTESDLTNANLMEANLSGTNLNGANLFGGNLIKVSTSGVKVNDDLKARNIKLVKAEDIDDRMKIKAALNDIYEAFRKIILRDNDELSRVFSSP